MTTTTTPTAAPPRPFHRWKSNETTDAVPYAYDYCLTCQAKRPSESGGAACTAAPDPTDPAPGWVLIARQWSDNLAVGPYPSLAVAEYALENAPFIESFCQDDALDAMATSEEPPAEYERVVVDATHSDYTGLRSLDLDGVTVTLHPGYDGATVVQVDTDDSAGRVRLNVNDAPVWDADPETGPSAADVDAALTLAMLALNTFLHPQGTDAAGLKRIDEHGEGALATLDRLRSLYRS